MTLIFFMYTTVTTNILNDNGFKNYFKIIISNQETFKNKKKIKKMKYTDKYLNLKFE